MKLRITTAIAGATFTYAAGDVVEIDDTEAAAYVAAGYAEPIKVDASKPTRTTAKTAPTKLETAIVPDLVPTDITTDPNA